MVVASVVVRKREIGAMGIVKFCRSLGGHVRVFLGRAPILLVLRTYGMLVACAGFIVPVLKSIVVAV